MAARPYFQTTTRIVVLSVTAATILAGCASTPLPTLPTWGALDRTDRFTDEQSCRVTLVGAIRMDVYRAGLRYYPYVERRGSDVRVGLMAHPTLPAPTGAIQIRVDALSAWTIDTSETPIDSTTANTAAQMSALMPTTADPAQADALRRSAEAMSDNITRSVSPYTAATGEKAREILAQMKVGQRVIYRTLGANAASTAGEAALGAEFNRALAECGL